MSLNNKHRLTSSGELRIHAVRQDMSSDARSSPTHALVLPGVEEAERQFIAYSVGRPEPDFPSRLVLLHATNSPQPFPFSAVVAAAQREGTERIELWGPFSAWDELAGGVDNDPEWTMPCIAQYGFGGPEGVVWKYCDK